MVKSNTSSHYNMDKINIVTKTVSEVTHEFYCDRCGAFIMRAEECEDGYFSTPPYYQICHIKLKGHYCEDCAKKKIKKAIETLQEMGFDI